MEKQGGFTSLPLEAGNMGLNDRRDFIAMFKKSIEDLNKLEMCIRDRLEINNTENVPEYSEKQKKQYNDAITVSYTHLVVSCNGWLPAFLIWQIFDI